jgi:hypothetical protein
MVAGSGDKLKLIVSPDAAPVIASRSEPVPLSCVFVTVMVAAKTGKGLRRTSVASVEQTHLNALTDGEGLIRLSPVLLDVWTKGTAGALFLDWRLQDFCLAWESQTE